VKFRDSISELDPNSLPWKKPVLLEIAISVPVLILTSATSLEFLLIPHSSDITIAFLEIHHRNEATDYLKAIRELCQLTKHLSPDDTAFNSDISPLLMDSGILDSFLP
jgi:hypothetical protein